jgi:hypothetical protein
MVEPTSPLSRMEAVTGALRLATNTPEWSDWRHLVAAGQNVATKVIRCR